MTSTSTTAGLSLALLTALACGCDAWPLTPCEDPESLDLGVVSGELDGQEWRSEGARWLVGAALQITVPDSNDTGMTLFLARGTPLYAEDEVGAEEPAADLLDQDTAFTVTLGDLSEDGGSARVNAGNTTLTSEHGNSEGGTVWVTSFADDELAGCFDLHASSQSGAEARFEAVHFRLPEFD